MPYDTAFHEYVHLHLKDSLPGAPLWLNEGLAEFYGALQFARGEALLGAPILPYVYLLRSSELLPLTTLFAIDGRSPHYNEQDKSGIFYGQSWALVHYLMLGADGARQQVAPVGLQPGPISALLFIARPEPSDNLRISHFFDY